MFNYRRHWKLLMQTAQGWTYYRIILAKIGQKSLSLFNHLALLVGLLASASNAYAAPQRIVSINLCADQLLMLLAEPEQIKAITHLSHEVSASYFYQQALHYPATKGLAEEILPYQPDLVIAGEYGQFHTTALLKQLGIRVETLPIANDLDTVFSNILKIAALSGHAAKGEKIVNELKQRLAKLEPISDQPPLAAVYEPNGYTVGAESLRGQMLTLAGWKNAGELAGVTSYGILDLETMVSLKPAALIDSPYSLNTYSRAEALARHPALMKTKLKPHVIRLPSASTICDGPWVVDLIEQLQHERQALTAQQR